MRPEVLYELLIRPPADGLRAVILIGVRINGALNLEAARMHIPLILHHCYFDGPIDLNQAQAPAISLTACHLPALSADQLETPADLELRQSTCGVVSLVGAHIGGQLSLSGATLIAGRHPIHLGGASLYPPEARDELADERVALAADGLTVDGSLRGERVVAKGKVYLSRTHIGGMLNFDGALLSNPCGEALRADQLRVDQGMFCRDGFAAEGEVRLPRAHIGGQLSFRGAALANQRGPALYADGLRVDQKMSFEPSKRKGGPELLCPFCAEGEMQLMGAHIGAQLSFEGADLRPALRPADTAPEGRPRAPRAWEQGDGSIVLSNSHIGADLNFTDAKLTRPDTDSEKPTRYRLNLDRARVDGYLRLNFERAPAEVDLTGARLGGLEDTEASWPQRLHLRGSVYDNLSASEDEPGRAALAHDGSTLDSWLRRLWRGAPPDVHRRLRWIRRAERGELYAPQPYTQLMALYRQQGRDGDARRVAFERERRRRGQLRWAGKAWNVFLQWTVGYGYRPLRLLVLLGALVFVGSLVFSSFHSDGDLTAVENEHPPFVAVIYTFDRLIPVVSFGLRDAFAPTGAAQWWAFAYTLLGWLLTVAVLAGLNAAVRRD